jgi:putative tryptophan/tyrosine transport system substrate-binding protein
MSRIKRREFITLLGGAAVAWPRAAAGQQPAMPVIGVLSSTLVETHVTTPIRRGLLEQGYVEGRNVRIEYRGAEGHYDRLPALASELVSLNVAAIAAIGSSPAALAAKEATSKIPIVFSIGLDAVEVGLVTSYNSPGGNVTGVTTAATSLTPKRLELLDELLPKSVSLAALINPTNHAADAEASLSRDAALALGRDFIVVEASTESEVEAAFETLSGRQIGGLVVWREAFFYSRQAQIATLARHHRIATIAGWRSYPAIGGFICYGPNSSEVYRQVGIYLGKILKGARPSDLPVMQPTTFELVVNLKAARELGIVIPPSLVARADEVIE